jgi:hypothetical protein
MHRDPFRICHNDTSKIINPASQWPMIKIFQLQEAGIYIAFSLEISCGFRISLAPSTLPSNNVIERWHDLLRLTQFLYYTRALLCLCYLQFKLVTLILIYICVCVYIHIYVFSPLERERERVCVCVSIHTHTHAFRWYFWVCNTS